MSEQRTWRASTGLVEVSAETPLLHWRKSSYSGVNNNCLEVADLSGATAVRDSKHPEAAVLGFPAAEWVAFLRFALADRL